MDRIHGEPNVSQFPTVAEREQAEHAVPCNRLNLVRVEVAHEEKLGRWLLGAVSARSQKRKERGR
jgi:hypothetical protein